MRRWAGVDQSRHCTVFTVRLATSFVFWVSCNVEHSGSESRLVNDGCVCRAGACDPRRLLVHNTKNRTRPHGVDVSRRRFDPFGFRFVWVCWCMGKRASACTMRLTISKKVGADVLCPRPTAAAAVQCRAARIRNGVGLMVSTVHPAASSHAPVAGIESAHHTQSRTHTQTARVLVRTVPLVCVAQQCPRLLSSASTCTAI